VPRDGVSICRKSLIRLRFSIRDYHPWSKLARIGPTPPIVSNFAKSLRSSHQLSALSSGLITARCLLPSANCYLPNTLHLTLSSLPPVHCLRFALCCSLVCDDLRKSAVNFPLSCSIFDPQSSVLSFTARYLLLPVFLFLLADS